MELNELTQLIETIHSNVFNRWTFFLIAVMAIIGGLMSKGKLDRNDSLILIIGLILGSAGNGYGIHKSVRTILTLENERKMLIESNDKYKVGNGEVFTCEFRKYLEGKSKYSAVIKIWYLLYIPLTLVVISLIVFRTNRPWFKKS